MFERKNNSWIIFRKVSFFGLTFGILIVGAFYAWQFYQKAYAEKIVIKNDKEITTKETLEILFAVPVLSEQYKNGITIEPNDEFNLEFDHEKRKIIITPKNFWQAETDYTISLPSGRTAMLTKIESSLLNFTTAELPKVQAITPADNSFDVLVGAEDPIIVDFNKSTKGYYIDFVLNPKSELIFQSNPEKTQFKILPKNPIEDGARYELKISAKILEDSDANYKQIYIGSFETLKTEAIVWEKDFPLRLAQAKKYTRAQIKEGKYVDINLKTQIMTTFENGKLLDSFLISSGKRGMETTIGKTQIYNKAPKPFSKKYGLYMPFWMALASDGKWGIHELPEWPGGYKEGTNHLGIPVSHGCVRLGVGSAKAVYDWAEIGTPVIVY